MQKIYDVANELKNLLLNSQEYKNYKKTKEEVYKGKNKEIIDDFRKKMMEYQLNVVNSGKENEEEKKQLKNLETVVMSNSEIAKYLVDEMKYSILFQDVYNILEEAMK